MRVLLLLMLVFSAAAMAQEPPKCAPTSTDAVACPQVVQKRERMFQTIERLSQLKAVAERARAKATKPGP